MKYRILRNRVDRGEALADAHGFSAARAVPQVAIGRVREREPLAALCREQVMGQGQQLFAEAVREQAVAPAASFSPPILPFAIHSPDMHLCLGRIQRPDSSRCGNRCTGWGIALYRVGAYRYSKWGGFVCNPHQGRVLPQPVKSAPTGVRLFNYSLFPNPCFSITL